MKFVFSRFFIVPLIVVLLDLYSFQAVKTVTENLSSGTKRIIYICFWAITFLVVLLLIAGMFKSYDTWPKTYPGIYLSGFLMILYVCKLIVVIFLLIDDLIRLVRRAVSLFTKKRRRKCP